MKCIKLSLIQKYIDGEASAKEIVSIENHLANCEICETKIKKRKSLALGIKRAMNHIVIDINDIPTFKGTDRPVRRKIISTEKVLYLLSAACISGIVFICINKQPIKEYQFSVVHSVSTEIDANKPISKQQLVIQVVDDNGKISEYNAQ